MKQVFPLGKELYLKTQKFQMVRAALKQKHLLLKMRLILENK